MRNLCADPNNTSHRPLESELVQRIPHRDVDDILRKEWVEEEELDRLKDLASDGPVIRLVQRLIDQAVAARASDVHLEPAEDGLHVRLRLDDLLREIENHPKGLAAPG